MDETTWIDGSFYEYRPNKLKRIEDDIKQRIKEGAKITIRELYKTVLGIDCPYQSMSVNGMFVDVDEWGWDSKGFRRLYRTIVTIEELD